VLPNFFFDVKELPFKIVADINDGMETFPFGNNI
jgi:hypothetical protein